MSPAAKRSASGVPTAPSKRSSTRRTPAGAPHPPPPNPNTPPPTPPKKPPLPPKVAPPLSPNPKHLAIDAQDNVLIAEDGAHRIRKYVVAEKKLVDVAGTGKKGAGGLGGPPALAELDSPHGVFFHRPTGVIYIGDTLNN